MPGKPPSNNRNHDKPVTKSKSGTPQLQNNLEFDDRLVTIAVSDLDRLKHMVEGPDALPGTAVLPSSTMIKGHEDNIGHPTMWKLRQNKDLVPRKQDRRRSAPDTLPFPGRAEASPLPPIAAEYHDIPSPKYPPFDLAQQVSDRREVLEAQARDIERALHARDREKRQPPVYVATAEQKVIFDRIEVAQLRLSMLVLDAGRSCLLFSQNGKFSEI
ncbi:hypothetical protein ACHAPU_005667 [Fusarium lateritium]